MILEDLFHEIANDALNFDLYSSIFATWTVTDTDNCLLIKVHIESLINILFLFKKFVGIFFFFYKPAIDEPDAPIQACEFSNIFACK